MPVRDRRSKPSPSSGGAAFTQQLAHYFSDTPDGAWTEFLRHEEITDPEDIPHIRRALWAVEVGDPPVARPELSAEVLTGNRESWTTCQREAARLRAAGASATRREERPP